jgi:RNA polymerase sigma-70 factor (ECF subfamily)
MIEILHASREVETDPQSDLRSDLELIDAVNEGDHSAFDVLYLRHRDWVVNLAFRFTRDRDLALDVLQDTFLYFLKKFPGFRLTAKLTTFFYPAVRNLSLTAVKKARRFQSDESISERVEAPEEVAPLENQREQLAAVMAGLSEEHREVLLLRFVEGMKMGEIAEVMGIATGTVKSRLHNALTTLRKDERTRKFFDK